jgi:glycosyltransferase involved in cell wall biosynthesis
MRILLTADPELPVPPKLYGGIERIIDSLARELKNRHEVGLVAHADSETTVQLFPWPGKKSQHPWDTLRNTLALRRAVRSFKPDVLHSFSRLMYMLPLLKSRLPKIMSYQRKPSVRQVARAAKFAGKSLTFTGCSEHICQQGRIGGGNWQAIHNFVELDKYTFQPQVSADAPLVFLSRVERIKGAHTAIEIARRARRRLIIAGNRVNDGDGAVYWEKEIAPHVGRDGIEYVGAVNDAQKNELLGKAAAMIVPVEWDEPFGIVFIEALACGTPVISCPRGALPEIVRHGKDGFLVNSIEEGVKAIQQLGSISRADCRQRVEVKFSSKVAVERYLELYGQLERQ